jgi:superfamily II DNA or RNA helicase
VIKKELRRWQNEALNCWIEAEYRGIVAVVTGGGKTVFALACANEYKPETIIVVVPTKSLLEQWWEEAANYFNLDLDDIHVLDSGGVIKTGTINIGVLNTASKISCGKLTGKTLLIIDECHKAASHSFRRVLGLPSTATLGLSATPERPYDNGLNELLKPHLGDIIYTYDYSQALIDGVIVPFELRNILFELEEKVKLEYNRLTKSIARSISAKGADDEGTIALLLKRARVSNASINRIKTTLRIVALHKDMRILIFHEDITACNIIHDFLNDVGFNACVYHSRLTTRERAESLKAYRAGIKPILVTCRALDEGFNVPETEIGIIVASTATKRQRIQRLGRVLRPSKGKTTAILYTLAATDAEVRRLKEEEEGLDGLALVSWSK